MLDDSAFRECVCVSLPTLCGFARSHFGNSFNCINSRPAMDRMDWCARGGGTLCICNDRLHC